ncbi:MAG TPA: ABC transporter ATP-binding protein [Acidimicrobiia bacterium]|nr:ABC transporter ATP-binding protein [Acidimicrobiia bacterium]
MRVVVRGVSFVYDGEATPALSHLDLEIESGSVHAIVGPNGCGKTTLLRLIAGLAAPTEGRIDFLGDRNRPNLTAIVFEEPRLLPHWNVERNIAIGHEFAATPPSLYSRIRDFYTQRVGLAGHRHHQPDQLSMGQQTMAGLGRALAHDSEVLLLDEPFAHLDTLQRTSLRSEFETHWQLAPGTVVLVTHDVDEAVVMSDRVSVMRPGPGPVLGTVEVGLPRPRSKVSPQDPGRLDAVAEVWRLLDTG